VKSLEGEQGLKIFSVPDTTCHFLSMNQNKPPYNNVKVRQAINYAIPIEAIMPNVLFGYGRQMKSPVPDITPSYDPSANKYKFDLEKAKALLKEAGFEKGFSTNMAIRVGWAPHEQAAIWIQREFEKVGIKVNIVKETDATFRQSMSKGDHEISIESWQSWVNDPFYHLQFNFNSKAKGTNVNFYSNPAVDKLIEDNMHEPNIEKRNAASREAQKIIIEDAVWGFLWYDNWTRVMKSDLYGLEKRWDTFERYYSTYRKA
jgi:peptide/nickel transport system substrate-binding protein